jgi:membrane-bound lytic murein transglycosylase D
VLEKLAAAHPPATGDTAGDPLDALSDGRTALSALDLNTYATHERVRYYLDFFQGPARNRMAIWLTRLPAYEPMIRRRFEQEGLPSDLVYLGLIESGYSNLAVSRSRAVGMWQFMRGTARWMGLRVDAWVDERRDPVKATDAAARYLAYLAQRFGSYYLAAAAYNGGPGAVSRGLERALPENAPVEMVDGVADATAAEEEDGPAGWTDADFFTLADTRHLRRETKDYVPKLIAAALIARDPVAYGFEPLPAVDPFPLDSLVVPDMTGLDVIADLAVAPLSRIRELNPQFLRLATPPGRSVVRLPAGARDRVAAAYAELPASKRVRYREHFVRRGETLSGIARRYRVTEAELRAVNPSVRRTSLIRIGQRLVVPTGGVPRASAATTRADARVAPRTSAGETQSHLVRRGETLSGLARRYGVSVRALMELNGIGSPRQLQAGRRIRIPG